MGKERGCMWENWEKTDELIRKSSSGDEDALDILIDRYRPNIEYKVEKSNITEQEDAIQDLLAWLVDFCRTYTGSNAAIRISDHIHCHISKQERIERDEEKIDRLHTEDRYDDICEMSLLDTFREILLDELLSELSSKERDVIALRYGLDGTVPRSQKDVAKKYNVTTTRIAQIEKKALRKMQIKASHKEYWQDYSTDRKRMPNI